jgi:hypothetical protein
MKCSIDYNNTQCECPKMNRLKSNIHIPMLPLGERIPYVTGNFIFDNDKEH